MAIHLVRSYLHLKMCRMPAKSSIKLIITMIFCSLFVSFVKHTSEWANTQANRTSENKRQRRRPPAQSHTGQRQFDETLCVCETRSLAYRLACAAARAPPGQLLCAALLCGRSQAASVGRTAARRPPPLTHTHIQSPAPVSQTDCI